MNRTLTVGLMALLLNSCAQKPTETPRTVEPPPEFPSSVYEKAPAGEVYAVNVRNSRAEIIVRRGGSLARLGHDHVITANDISGLVQFSKNDVSVSRADLNLDLNSLIVDQPESRRAFELDTEPSAADIRKTTSNMRERTLHTDQWPEMHLFVDVTGISVDTIQAKLTIWLHGQRLRMPLTFQLMVEPDGALVASGVFSLLQSDFGIQPFSILSGALRVADEVTIHFHIEAQPRT